ncbi:unnamed protein product [Caenorhabditis nigoni]|uniref:F-box domain-containing protein n=1 Tax=Caenorhabditis nigoni TaxID=1611254 RepID=A0A2G5VP54_9PELO|nr:hypothetical protein B9Z55_003134 [Caenorhabditis nigoni]
MPIALFKFPNDLLREVLNLCDPFELYKLSKCSKKCSQKATMLRDTKMWKIGYYGGNDMTICADGSNYHFKKTQKPRDYFKTERALRFGRYNDYMYIEFPKGGSFELFVYLLETFGIRTVKSMEALFGKLHNVSKVAKLLMDRKMEIEEFRINKIDNVQDAVNIMPMLSQMNITQFFECSIKFPPDFQFEFVNYPSQISISKSFWLNINQLSNCTCTRVHLQQSMLTNKELNVLLHEWKNASALPNLRVLEIESNNIDNQSPILDMIPPIINANNPRVSIFNKFYDTMIDGVQVKKNDGTEGWMRVDLGYRPALKLFIVDPADTVVEEIPEDDDDDW